MTATGNAQPALAQGREMVDGLHRWSLPRASWREEYLCILAQPDELPSHFVERSAAALREVHATPLKMTFFGDLGARHAALLSLEQLLGTPAWPITWVEGAAARGGPIAGVHIHAVSGAEPETLTEGGRPVARLLSSDHLRMAVLADLAPPDRLALPRDQAYGLYRTMDRVLLRSGFTFHDVCRTWLFVDRILDWYPGLNEARNQYFTERCVYQGLVPASTGIGAANATGHAIVAEALAIQGEEDAAHLAAVQSPLQCSAHRYGSAFSRAVEITCSGARQLLVSGTASIGRDGATLHQGDSQAQVAHTMAVVEALLRARGFGLLETSRAVAYLKHQDIWPMFQRYLHDQGLEQMPVIAVIGDICRHDLLFEIELDAITALPIQDGR